jgi:hypothetical protein
LSPRRETAEIDIFETPQVRSRVHEKDILITSWTRRATKVIALDADDQDEARESSRAGGI